MKNTSTLKTKSIFKEDKKGKQPSREEICEAILSKWRAYGEEYRTLPDRYHSLLETMRSLKISPLNILKKNDVKEYPEVPFLRIEKKAEAKQYLAEISVCDALHLFYEIEMALDSYIYVSMKNRITEYNYKIRNHGARRSLYCNLDPDKSITRNGRRTSSKRLVGGE